MSDKTGIEWTDATWNPIRGCSRVSDGCRHCYAEGQAARIISMDRGRGIPEGQGSYDGLLARGGQWNGKITVVDESLGQPLRWQKPRMIFVNSMSDLFHESVPDYVIYRIFAVMAIASHHTFQVLTKRPLRMQAFLRDFSFDRLVESCKGDDGASVIPRHTMQSLWHIFGLIADSRLTCYPRRDAFPLPNVWIGVSVEDQGAADERIPLLLGTPAAVRWISAEPLLGPVDLLYPETLWPEGPERCCDGRECACAGQPIDPPLLYGIDWVVVGGESGPKARPMHPQWATDLRDQCAAAGVPFLFKQWGEWAPGECVTRKSGVVPTASLSWEWQFSTEDLASEGGHIDDEPDLYRIGKRAAGRLLNGVQHDGYPPKAGAQ